MIFAQTSADINRSNEKEDSGCLNCELNFGSWRSVECTATLQSHLAHLWSGIMIVNTKNLNYRNARVELQTI